LVDDLEVWLKTQRFRISAKSRLGEKLSYIAKYMGRLKLSLEDGTVEMDSNIVERAIRPIALNRKNALFAGHDEGGRTWARIVSLIETCKLNGVEPYAYLKATYLPPEAPSFITRVCGFDFIFFVVSLGKRVVRGALKLLQRSARFCGCLVAKR
jgi:hypothetical protein